VNKSVQKMLKSSLKPPFSAFCLLVPKILLILALLKVPKTVGGIQRKLCTKKHNETPPQATTTNTKRKITIFHLL
jgi:hypothetical protein